MLNRAAKLARRARSEIRHSDVKIGETVEWQNGRMAEWQNGGMAEWRNNPHRGMKHRCMKQKPHKNEIAMK